MGSPRHWQRSDNRDVQPDRVSVVEENLDRYLASAAPAERLLADHEPLRAGGTLTALQAGSSRTSS